VKGEFTLFKISMYVLAAAGVLFTGGRQQVRAGSSPDQPGAPAASCGQYMAPRHNYNGKAWGQEECLMQDAGVVDPEHKVHRVEIGLNGTLSGVIVKEGIARLNHFTSAPDFIFTQYGNTSPRFHGFLRYEAAKGTSLTLLYPETGWNGKLFVMVHGSGGSFRRGSMKPWDQVLNPAKPWSDVTKYEKAMLSKGYAVARTRRNADRFVAGDYSAVLDDGEVWPDLNINEVPELLLDEVRLVDRFLTDRLGHKPFRNYWYGHSAGAYTGLAINYLQEPNKEPDGKNLIDGFIDDDPGGGMFIPVLYKNGQDVLFRTPEEKAKFVKSIILAHQLYPLTYDDVPGEMDLKNIPKYISSVFLDNKRTMVRVMKEKRMDGGFRSYEVKGISHNGFETLPDGVLKERDIEVPNFARLMDGVIDLLDNWVEKNVPPPATKSEAAGLGGKPEAVNLPETACPLGVYFPYPTLRGEAGSGDTSFVPFDGQGMEPLNGRLQIVDMNGDGKRSPRETMTQAWRRLGLLKPGETFSREKYVACVQDSVSKLRKEGFLTEKGAQAYLQEAPQKDFPSQ